MSLYDNGYNGRFLGSKRAAIFFLYFCLKVGTYMVDLVFVLENFNLRNEMKTSCYCQCIVGSEWMR